MKAFLNRLINLPFCTSCLFYNHFKQTHFSFKWRILYRRVKPGGRFHHCFFMTEGFKRIPAMVLPAAAEASSAKRQVVIG